MVRESKYLVYRLVTEPKRKTPIIFVCNKSSEELGQIRFYPQWRKFVFYPEADTLFDSNCLEDIISTINLIQQMWINGKDFEEWIKKN